MVASPRRTSGDYSKKTASIKRQAALFRAAGRGMRAADMAGAGYAAGREQGTKMQKAALGRLSANTGTLADSAGGGRQSAQRWRALKRGFDLQITKILPRRRTTLQSR